MDVEIKGKISVDAGNTAKSINELNQEIKDTKKVLSEARIGSEEYKLAQKKLQQSTEELNKATGDSGGTFGKLKETLGNTIPGFKGASEGASGFGKQLWALVANPIVAIIVGIVGALTLLYKAFASTNDGIDKMEQMMAGLGAVMDVLRDRVVKIGSSIVKFFSGDFKGAIQEAKGAASGIGEEIAREFSAAAKATQVLQDLDDKLRDLSVSRAKLNADLAEAKEKINDTELSALERRANVAKVRAAEAKQNKEELDEAEARLKAMKDKASQSDTLDEEQGRIAEQQAKVYQLRERSSTQIRQLNRLDRQIEREEQSKRAEERRAYEERRKTELTNLRAFESQSLELNNELLLSKIKDAQEKELLQVTIGLEKQKETNRIAVIDKQLTQAQADELNLKQEQLAVDKRLAIQDKYLQEQKKKDADAKKLADDASAAEEKAADALSLRKINFQLQQAIGDLEAQRSILDRKQALIEEQYQKEINAANLTAQQKAEIEQKHTEDAAALSEARIRIDEAEKSAKLNTVAQIGSMFGQLSEIAGKSTVAGKALAIAQTSIDTYVSAQKAYSSMAGIPVVGPTLGAVAAGVAVAGGLANIKKIVSVQVPGSGGSFASLPSVSVPSAPIRPQRSSTAIDASSIQGIGNAANGGVSRSFVLDSDIKNNQERAARINRAARLG